MHVMLQTSSELCDMALSNQVLPKGWMVQACCSEQKSGEGHRERSGQGLKHRLIPLAV